MSLRKHLVWACITLALALAVAWGASTIANRRAVASLAATARTDAHLRAALLDSELARFRLLPTVLADDHDVVAALEGAPGARDIVDRKLEALAGSTGTEALFVIGADGKAIAASNWRSPSSFVGNDYNFRRYFREAKVNGEASQFALGVRSGRPGLYLARRAATGGVVVVKLGFERIETAWARAGGVTYVDDRNGVVVVTSRQDWRFAASEALSAEAMTRFRREASMPPGSLARLPVRRLGDGLRVAVGGVPYVSVDAPISESGWTLTLLRRAVLPAARSAAILAALAVMALGAIGWGLMLRSSLARRRTVELEQAVAERTGELRREIEERIALETRAAELREGLRQANRLASLGQITASVAHETAQPVAAIRTYAHNSTTLLDRGETDPVRANLTAIARLADRIGAVTSELRDFSRRKAGEVRAVLLSEVIDGALLILKDQLRSVVLERPDIYPSLAVLGGKVRLEQVLVNLLQNAIEALTGRPDAKIIIDIRIDGEIVRLTVSDNGPGVAPEIAERLFTPFATSRDNGLGLGLVIAKDIVLELGGTLNLVPVSVGACFEMELRKA